MKKTAVGVVIFIGVVILILAILPFAIDLNKHKDTILAQIKTHTNRQVDFQSIRLTILTGLGAEIKGLRISDDPAFSSEDFLSLNAAKVSVAILPLLSKQIKIKTVVLKEPRIHVVKNSQGVFNFTTLIIPKPGEEPKKKTPKPGAFAALLVSNVVIKHGAITYRDDTLKNSAKPFTISNLDLESQDISMLRPVSFSLSASVMNPDGQNFALAGTIGPVPGEGGLGQTPIDVHLLLDALPLNTLPVNMPFQAGTMKIDITAKGILNDKITSKAVMDLTGLKLSSAAGTQQVKDQKGISCRISSDMALVIEKQQLMIGNGTFEIGQDRGNFEGSVQNIKTTPTWNISLKSSRITPGPVLAQLPMFAGLIPGKIMLTGPAGFSVTTTGNKEAFQVNTAIDMRPMAITFGKIFDKPVNSPMSFSSRMIMKKDITEINALDINLGAITATGTGEVRKVQDKSSYQIRIQTNKAPLETAQALIPMLQAFKPTGNIVLKTAINGGAGAMTVNVSALSDHMGLVLTKPTAEDQAKGKFLAGPVTASLNGVTLSMDALKKEKGMGMNGTIKSRQGTIKDLPFTNLTSTFTYADDQFKVNSFDLAALKGSIKGAVSYNLKTKAWEASPTFNNVQAGNVLDTMTSFKGVFAGTLTGDVKARGVAGAPALNNLGAQVNLRINKGEWKNFDLAGKVQGTLAGVPGLSEAFGLAPSEVQKYQTTRFETMNAQVDLAHKVINVNSMQLLNISSGKDLDTESRLKGTISMETNQLDLKGQVILPKRFSQRMGARAEAFSALMNEQKRLVLPMTITGSLKKPIPMVDTKSLSSAMTRYYATKALDKGLKKLQDKVGLPQGTEDTKKNIQNMLEGLFKKKK
jgi:uncharacterized protein involved in outer membrane biogenesis